MTILLILAVWFVLSIPLALWVGRMLADRDSARCHHCEFVMERAA